MFSKGKKIRLKQGQSFNFHLVKPNSISKIWISIPETDNTPISLMEAMAAGCIPVKSDLFANRDWVEDGKNGIIVSDYSSNYIERALSLDYDSLVKYNIDLLEREGTKNANRKKFYSIFDKEFKR